MQDRSSLPAGSSQMVVPSDSVTFTKCRALYVGVQGTVVVRHEDGSTVPFVGASGVLPVEAIGVMLTGTTASSIVAMY